MASPEVARLAPVLDIKETVDQHTDTLAAMQQTQAQHGELLAEILRRLGGGASG